MPSVQVLALDIGGTKLAAGLVDGDGRLSGAKRIPTPVNSDAEVLWSAVTGLLDGVLGAARCHPGAPVALGVGCGGPMQAEGVTVSPLNIAGWRGFPLRDRLVTHTGLAVFVDNDAKALARGEGWVGAAAGVRNYLAMVVSTGVGGGLVCDGRLVDGASGNAGHIGHVVVEPDGRRCACGGQGCLEAEASGPSIRAATGIDPAAASEEVRRRTGRLVGRAVASVVNLLDLELVTVGGSVALGFGVPFFDAANAELAKRSRLDFSAGTPIVPAGLGQEGPLVGAGAVAWAALGRIP